MTVLRLWQDTWHARVAQTFVEHMEQMPDSRPGKIIMSGELQIQDMWSMLAPVPVPRAELDEIKVL